jgi:hypothetical protein
MTDTIICISKDYINADDLVGLQEYFADLQESEFSSEPSWDYIFQKVYLHACLKKRITTAEWLIETVFPKLGAIQQIALRQIFSYGKHLLNRTNI